MNSISHLLLDKLIASGMSESLATNLNMLSLLFIMLILLYLVDLILKKIIITTFNKISVNTQTNFDDLLVKNKAPRNLGHIFPLLVALELNPYVFLDFH